jgi:GH24 family phage-related lysozyme (muramidase)
MTFASVRAAAEHVARQGRLTPHQLAALGRLDELLTDAQRKEFTDLWRAQGSPAAPAPSTPLAAGIALIREFEGVHLQAYRCPAGVPTIGWGSTRYADGRAVAMGDQITRAEADALLTHEVLRIAERLARTVPGWVTMNDNQRGALVSFAYNLGAGFYGAQGFSTITHALAQRRWEDVPAAMLLYRNPGSSFEAGLRRRREAEGRLWMTSIGLPPLHQGNPLQVPWYAQLDSADREQAARMCFSSSCAMLLQYLKPGTLTGPNGDDQYLTRVRQYGDTTDPTAQVRALSSYGIRARFTKVANFYQLEEQINRGVPMPCGFLHRGPVTKPSGSGHWLCVVGHDKENVIVHDPFGMADLVTGQTIGGTARFARYARKHFGPRWMVEGNATGWAIIAERPS